MDRGSWQATVHKGHKELDVTEVTEHVCLLHYPFLTRVLVCSGCQNYSTEYIYIYICIYVCVYIYMCVCIHVYFKVVCL